jgi:hypothetical protein
LDILYPGEDILGINGHKPFIRRESGSRWWRLESLVTKMAAETLAFSEVAHKLAKPLLAVLFL